MSIKSNLIIPFQITLNDYSVDEKSPNKIIPKLLIAISQRLEQTRILQQFLLMAKRKLHCWAFEIF
jgi:hypothetical protein